MLRIISYNIHSGKDFFWRKRLKAMATTLVELKADVICLQEVHQNKRFGFQADFFQEELAMKSVFSPSIPFEGGGYGNALFTNLTLEEVVMKKLPAQIEGRSLLQVKLTKEASRFHIWATHLSLDKRSRELQMRYLSNEVSMQSEPLLLLGDFNTTKLALPNNLSDAAKIVGKALTPTVLVPPLRFDYILASAHWKVQDYHVIDVRWSDHRPIQATLTLSDGSVLEE
ncbi:endonuclease/exonuclease/phosphatase family protein [Brevibacillus ginsengisoli]|uniref:endonuclease/exonuclease/phosphatase family protein n=1 Tax=Brevibacillus ginsengisoli TaxID=363854 RepID=UPI003CF69557